MNGIDFPIVIEEHGEVVDTSLHVMMFPWASDILAGIALQSLAVDIREDIELTIGVADGRCPDALTIYLLVVFKRESIIVEVETVEAITDVLPVHQVFRMEDDKSGHGVHRGACQIIVVADTKDIGI